MKIKIILFFIFLIKDLIAFPKIETYEFKQRNMQNIRGIFVNYKVYLTDNLSIDNVKKLNHISTFRVNLVVDKAISTYLKEEQDVIKAGNEAGIFLEFRFNNSTYYAKFSSIKYILRAIEDFTKVKGIMKNSEIKDLEGSGIFLYKDGVSYDLTTNLEESAIFVNFFGFKDNTGRPYFIFYYDNLDNGDKNFKTVLISFEEFHNGIREGLFLLRNEQAILELINLIKR